MPEQPKPTARGAVAGSLGLAVIVLCAAIGAGLGVLLDLVFPLALAGFFAGVVLSFVVLYQRFKDI